MENMPSSYMEKTAWQLVAKNKYFSSHIPFLMEMGGINKGKLHVLMSGTHAGKSTMVRTILVDLVNNIKEDEKVLVYLSEESVSDFLKQLSYAEYNTLMAHNIKFDSEIPEKGVLSPSENYHKLVNHMESGNYDVVIFDNITTSSFYTDLKPGQQGEIIRKFKSLSKTNNFGLVVVAHASTGGLSGKLLTPDDVKYSRQVSNLSEFFWIIQKFTIGNMYYSFLFVEKHRGVEIKNRLFSLTYCKDTKIFKSVNAVDFDSFKEYFLKRNKL